MMYKTVLALLAATGSALAQRPTNTSICDYYTTALFTNNTAANQLALVTAVVTRAALGNTTANAGLTGIVNKGTYNGTSVNLLPYFNGMLNSTNRGGSMGVSVNFLDNSTNQMTLFTHLNEYFGSVLGCSQYGMSGYPAYAGQASMLSVHQFMDLSSAQVSYFNTQVGLSALSFGVTMADVTIVGNALNSLFGYRCAPAATVIAAQGAQLQSICIDPSCPLANNSNCAAYPAVLKPTAINGTNSTSSGTSTTTMSGGASPTSSKPAGQTTNAASNMVVGGLVGAAALLFAL